MIVVSDTSPINYLILINQVEVLPRLFGRIIIPDAVRDEMLNLSSPPTLQRWINQPPDWLVVRSVEVIDQTLSMLDVGEQSAITLTQLLPADLLIIDERSGRRIANARGIPIVGTLGVLDDAANQGLINLEESIDLLRKTNFRISTSIIRTLLKK